MIAVPVGVKLKSFFGDEVDLSSYNRHDTLAKRSWRNTVLSFAAFLILLYCFAIQIWVVVRSFQASHTTSEFSPDGFVNETTSASTSVMATRTLSKMASATITRKTTFSRRPEATAGPVEYLWERSFGQKEPTEEISTPCLYLPGSEVSDHGALAVVFNVFYNLWVALFVIILLSYEHKRLRFKRKVHSAAVVGLIQAWM